MHHELGAPPPCLPNSRSPSHTNARNRRESASRNSFICHSYELPRNHHKTRDFKSILCHSYGQCAYKSFACHSYRKHRGVHQLFPKRNPSSPVPSVQPIAPSPLMRAVFASPHTWGRGRAPFPRDAGHGPRAPEFRIPAVTCRRLSTFNCQLSTIPARATSDLPASPYIHGPRNTGHERRVA